MAKDYIVVTIRYPYELDERVNQIIYMQDVLGAQVIDPRDLEQYEQYKAEWELTDHEELLSQMQNSAEQKIEEGYIIQNVFFEDSKRGGLMMEQMEQSFYERFGGQIEILNEKTVNNDHWDEEWKKYYEPIQIGESILVLPAWQEIPKTDRTVILIDPGMAFGTGSHETTTLCLEALERINLEKKKVLDMGSGSGILGIYAKKKGAELVDATDIDTDALASCEKNAKRNHVEMNIFQSDLLEQVSGKYDVICANLLAEILVRMLEQAKDYLTEEGVLFLSGILLEKTEMVEDKLREEGYVLIEKRIMDEWVMLGAKVALERN